MKMKSMARSGAEGNCRLLSKYGGGSSGPRQHYASGGVVKARADGGSVMEEEEVDVEGEEAMPRLDKPSRKPKGESKTVVNVVIAGKDDSQGMPALGGPPMGLPAGGAPGGLPGGGPAGGMPPMPMRKHGGRVTKAEGGGVKDYLREKAKDEAEKAVMHGVVAAGNAAATRLPFGKAFKGLSGATGFTNAGIALNSASKASKARDAADAFEKTGLPDKPERANGGVVMKDGSGGGEGRLEKVRKYGK